MQNGESYSRLGEICEQTKTQPQHLFNVKDDIDVTLVSEFVKARCCTTPRADNSYLIKYIFICRITIYFVWAVINEYFIQPHFLA